jgi:hypothetical protein
VQVEKSKRNRNDISGKPSVKSLHTENEFVMENKRERKRERERDRKKEEEEKEVEGRGMERGKEGETLVGSPARCVRASSVLIQGEIVGEKAAKARPR